MLYIHFPPHLTHVTTCNNLLNADVLNCYITLKFLICNQLSDDRISTQSKLKYGLFSSVVSCHNSSVQNCHNLCSKCARVHGHKCLDDDATGCSSINDRLVKLHPLFHQTISYYKFNKLHVSGALYRTD